MSSNGTRTIRFGVFEVDLRARELRRSGVRVKLQEQPLQVLALLLERPGDIVSREELQARLWPADTFVDFDHSLNAAVRRLRDALGDSAENPRFVETVARRGYRFLAPVSGAPPAVSAEIPGPASKSVRTWQVAVAATALLLAGIGLGLFVGRKSSKLSLTPPPVVERRLTANLEEYPISNAALSHDGRYLAFSDDTGFYLREVDTGETHSLALPQGFKAQPVAWFPDGTHILATSVAGPTESSALWRLSTIGGSPRKLSDQGSEGAVSPDGSMIVFLRGAPNSQEVWLMQSDGGQPRKVAGEVGDLFRSPVWSPEGKRVAFLRASYHPGILGLEPGIEILDLASRQRQTVVTQSRLGPAMAWIDDQLVYALNEAPPSESDSNIWSVKIDSHTGQPLGPATRLTSSSGSVEYLSAADGGKRLAYLKRVWQRDIFIAKIEAGGSRLGALKRLTLDERQDLPTAWTPDSKQVIFASDRDGAYHIFRQAPEQTMPELVIGGSQQSMLPRLTPDGKEIVYLQYHLTYDPTQTVRMMRVPLAGGPPQLVLEHRGMSNLQCARLPSTLCVYSQVEGDRMRFFSFDPDRGKAMEVAQFKDPTVYFNNWSLSPDGSTLAIAKKMVIAVQPEIRLVTLKDGKERTIKLMNWSGISALDWSADGKNLWVSATTTIGKDALLKVDMQGSARPVLEQTKMAVGWAIPSPDGRYLAIWQASANSNVWMIQNF